MVEFSNFHARMSLEVLDIGASTKRGNKEAAGTHGEGFKVGAVVMLRRGYRVQYEATAYYWTLKFGGHNQGQLYCTLSPMGETKLKELKDMERKRVAAGVTRGLHYNIWEDVTVKIGRVNKIGERVAQEDFLKWLSISLDLNPPSEMIQTPNGSLILDEEFGGRLYLKSLLLKENNTGKKLKFGYNLFRGNVDRDRKRLPTGEEAWDLAEIWAGAIRLRPRDTLDKYVALLREDKNADVNGVENHISESMARIVWSRLLEQDSQCLRFYHDTENGNKVRVFLLLILQILITSFK
jgi:hypothetical protein